MRGIFIFIIFIFLQPHAQSKATARATEVKSIWTNSCASDTSGDKVHQVKVGDDPVSPLNCTIKKGRTFDLILEFSLDKVAETLTLSCHGKYGFLSISVLSATRDCNTLNFVQEEESSSRELSLTREGGIGGLRNGGKTCTKLLPGIIYQFKRAGSCPSWIPSLTIDIICTCTNEDKKKTHCVRFPCRVHS